MSVTLKQIAQRVGVSQPLVTYALNGKPGVSDAMRQKILKAAGDMGYSAHANRAAKVLIARRHGTTVRTEVLALLLPPMSGGAVAISDHPFFLPYFCGVEIEAARRDYSLFVCAMRGDRLPSLIAGGGVDGVISVYVPQAFPSLREMNVPYVALGFEEDDSRSLVPDDAAGIAQVVAYLAERGHRRIAYMGIGENLAQPARRRVQAFRKEMKKHGLAVDKKLIEATSWEVEREAGAQLLDKILRRSEDFTALVCYNDVLAMGAVERLQELGRKVPDDVAVVGFDGYANQIGFRPSLASASFDRQAMGRRAVEMLCEQLDEGGEVSAAVELFPTQLEHGETA